MDDLKATLLELKRAKLKKYEQSKYESYVPIGKTEEFLDKFGSGNYLAGAYLAANGVGKTAALVNIIANICYPTKNPYFHQKIFTNYPFQKKVRIASDPTTVKEAIIPALKEWLPKGRYTVSKEGKHYESKWITDTGFELDIMTYDQDPKEFESANIGVILLDEPPPNDIFKACVSRLRNGGVMGILCTPLTGSAWLYDEFIANPNLEEEFKFVVTAEVEDACEIHGIRGFLKHENIVRMIAQYDEEDKQARIFGKFQHLIGLVFKNFRRNIHVIKPFEINSRDFVVIDALDTHPRNPDAYLQVAIDRYGTKYVIDEIYINATEGELAERIKKKQEGKRFLKHLIEPAAFTEDQHHENKTENSLAKRFTKLGLNFVPGSKRRFDAVRRIKQALYFTIVKDHFLRKPEIYIFDTCTRLIWEIEHWQWSEWTGKTKDRKSPKETPEDKDDHLIEDLGRILLEEPSFTELVEEKYVEVQQNLDPYDQY